MPYRRKRESLQSYAPDSIQLIVEGSTDIHAPLRMTYSIWRASYVDAAAQASPSDVYTATVCRRWISSLPSIIKFVVST